MKNVKRFAATLLLVWIGALVAVPSSAQDTLASSITSGDLCAPVNVGKAIRTIQNIRGLIVNISAEESINISCPVITSFPALSVDTIAVIENGFDTEQSSRCVLREISLTNQTLQTLVVEENIAAGGGAVFSFEGIVLSDPTSRLNLTCSLPPASGLGLLIAQSTLAN